MKHGKFSDLSLRHFRAFATVVENRRLSTAANQLRRSPSAVSRSLSVLEGTFGARLLERTPAGFGTTLAGQKVMLRCGIIQSEFSACREQLARTRHSSPRNETALFSMQCDTSHLRALTAVHDFRSIQRAAHYLSLSQPAISYSIRLLENDLGVELFSRTSDGMIPTPPGISVTVTARRVLSEVSRMFDDVRSVEGPSTGLVSVGGLAYSRAGLLPEAIEHVLKRHPQIMVRTVEGPIETLLSALHGGDIDTIICAYPDRSYLEGVEVEPIASDPLGFFVSRRHSLASQKNIVFTDLLDQPFILPPSGSITRQLLEDFFLRMGGTKPQGRVETSSYSVVRNLLLESGHIAFRSKREFSIRQSDERIVRLDTAFELPVRTICLLQRQGTHLTAAVQDFLGIVRSVASSTGK